MDTPDNTFTFTVPRLAALPAKTTRYEVRDSDAKGLILRVTPQGVKTFGAFAWVPKEGRPQRITIGKFPATRLDAARKQAGAFIDAIAEGKSPRAERLKSQGSDTFTAAFEKYMVEHVERSLKGKTAVDTRGVFDNHLRPLHRMRLDAITTEDVEAIRRKFKNDQPRSINRATLVIRRVFKHATTPRWASSS